MCKCQIKQIFWIKQTMLATCSTVSRLSMKFLVTGKQEENTSGMSHNNLPLYKIIFGNNINIWSCADTDIQNHIIWQVYTSLWTIPL